MRNKDGLPNQNVCASVMDAIGGTPLVMLSKLFAHAQAQVMAKLEFMNPGGSIKDRMVRHMLRHAAAGERLAARRVVEGSSGNTGAALAMASAVYDFQCDITVPDKTSVEKIKRIQAYGAAVHVCPSDVADDHPSSYHAMAAALARDAECLHLDQYCSTLNADAHYADTAPELWAQLDGECDVFVCGIGSGGTISGIGRYLKEQNPAIRVIGVEPLGSGYGAVNHGDEYASRIEGVGKRRPARSFDRAVVDDIVQVSDDDALAFCLRLAREEGIFAGGSSGCVAAGIAQLLPALGAARVVTIFPDSGAFYLSKYF
jgi:cystathionine beta-synthase